MEPTHRDRPQSGAERPLAPRRPTTRPEERASDPVEPKKAPSSPAPRAAGAWEPARQPLAARRPTAGAGGGGDEGRDGPRERREPAKGGRRGRRPLPLRTRIAFWTLGILLVLLGLAGLVLPGLQGILFLIFGAAVLSLASERLYRWLRRRLADRAPGLWRRLERFRTRVRWRFRAPPE